MLTCKLKRTSKLFFIVVIFLCIKVIPLKAHEMSPSILDLTINPNLAQLKIRFSIEAMLAEIDLSEISNTNLSENADKYDNLRTFKPNEIKHIFNKKWPNLSKDMQLIQSGRVIQLDYLELTVPDVGNELASVSVTEVVCPAANVPPLFIVVMAGFRTEPP